MDIEKKRQHEIEIMDVMIRIYCKGNHKTKGGLCPECEELFNYATARTQKCPFMAEKTFCSACKVHCYQPKMREKVCMVMKYSGPRMMLHHPILAIRHALVTLKEVRRGKRGERNAGKGKSDSSK